MPAGITASDDMAYVGRTPWHGLGTHVEGLAMTAEEAIASASLDWEVKAIPVYVDEFGMESFKVIEGKKAITRLDTGKVFTVMSDRYTPVQNVEAFSFFDSIVGSGDAIYHTAGSLYEGRKVWILARLEGDYVLDNGEKLESYILLDNSHDGSSALRMRLTTVRVVCSNTLRLANAVESAFSARHTSGIMTRAGQARNLLGLNKVHMDRFMADCNRIADQAFSRTEMTKLTYKLLELNPDKHLNEQYPSRALAGDTLISLFSEGQGNQGETRWDAFNAVTEFSDYHRVFSGDDLSSQRLNKSWFAKGKNLRDEAFRILTLPQIELDSALTFSAPTGEGTYGR